MKNVRGDVKVKTASVISTRVHKKAHSSDSHSGLSVT
jgi:hypothetical protein